jgi:pSer/pThr/pTyr-binding forkhead associated (FHA) protein
MSKILALTFIAGIAGLAVWAITEPFAPGFGDDTRWAFFGVWFWFLLGAFVGGALGGASGYRQGSRAHFWRGLLTGAILGGIGATIGMSVGAAISSMIFGPDVFSFGSQAGMHIQIPARILAFVPVGGLLGLTHGLGARSMPRAIQGMIGGLIGAGAAGASFDIIGSIAAPILLAARGETVGEVGIISRAATSILIGVGVGLFAGIVEALSRKAWIRLELGRNEGKEWIVDAQQTFIGRSESAHIPLFGDANVQPMHACIVRERGMYRLVDGGSQMGIGVNGIRVPEAYLNHGDVVNVGSFSLRFLMKDQAAPIRQDAAASAPPVAIGLPPMPQPAPPPAAAPATLSRELVVVDGPMAGSRYHVGQMEVIAGREGPDIPMSADTTASRRHASFRTVGDSMMVRDLGSTNGTIVNGVRVQEMSLRPGDLVRIGATTLRVE